MTNCKKLEKVVFDLQKNMDITSFAASNSKYYDVKEYFGSASIYEVDGKNVFDRAEEILYVTDDVAKARYARNQGIAVLIFMNDENRGQDFGGFQYFLEGFEDVSEEYFYQVYQREKKLPWTIARTDRLMVREMTMEDKEALYALYEDKSVTKYMEDLPQDSEEQQTYIAEYIEKMYGLFEFGMWLVEKKDTGEIIGRVGFQNTEAENEVELGFLIAPKFQGHGYAYEACKAAMEYMKEHFAYLDIVACCDIANDAARGLCRKLGFTREEIICYNFVRIMR